MAETFIYLIRHGKYFDKKSDKKEGHLDRIGREQAKYTGLRLKKVDFDSFVASSLPRAIETAEIIQKHAAIKLKLELTDDLRECLPTIPPRFADTIKAPASRVRKSKATLDGVAKKLFQKSKGRKDKHHLVVCHGNVIRYLIVKALGAKLHLWASLYINHCSVSVIRINKSGEASLLAYNAVDFLPRRLKTDSGKGLHLNFF